MFIVSLKFFNYGKIQKKEKAWKVPPDSSLPCFSWRYSVMMKRILVRAAIRLLLDYLYNRIRQKNDDKNIRDIYLALNRLLETV